MQIHINTIELKAAIKTIKLFLKNNDPYLQPVRFEVTDSQLKIVGLYSAGVAVKVLSIEESNVGPKTFHLLAKDLDALYLDIKNPLTKISEEEGFISFESSGQKVGIRTVEETDWFRNWGQVIPKDNPEFQIAFNVGKMAALAASYNKKDTILFEFQGTTKPCLVTNCEDQNDQRLILPVKLKGAM